MGRFDKYRKAVEEEMAFNEEQDRLHEKHQEVAEETVIIETSNMGKFLLNFTRSGIRTIVNIALILLATVGILTLLYPETRTAFMNVIGRIILDIKHLI